jgi:hypothetical protein|nr:MAG TPA: hypothetical protein [Caudoviricetes sp.]
MTIITDTYIPYEFPNRIECLKHIEQRCHGIKKSLRFIEMDNEHLDLRCPLSGDYITVVGEQEDLDWLHAELTKRRWYRTN